MSSKEAERDIKQTRRVEDDYIRQSDDVINAFMLQIGSLLTEDKNISMMEVEQLVTTALNESGYDAFVNDMLTNGYQELVNQGHELYKEITGEEKIILTDETAE